MSCLKGCIYTGPKPDNQSSTWHDSSIVLLPSPIYIGNETASASSQVKHQPDLQQPLWKGFHLWTDIFCCEFETKHSDYLTSMNLYPQHMCQHNDKSQPLLVDFEESMSTIQSIFFSAQHSNQTSPSSVPAVAQWTLSTLHKAGPPLNKSPAHSSVQRSTTAGWHQLSSKGKAGKPQAMPQLLTSPFPLRLINTWINLVALSWYFKCANNIFFCCCKAAQLSSGICCLYFCYDSNSQVPSMKTHSLLKTLKEKKITSEHTGCGLTASFWAVVTCWRQRITNNTDFNSFFWIKFLNFWIIEWPE